MNNTLQDKSQDLFKITYFKDSIKNVTPYKSYEKTFKEIYTLFNEIKFGEKDGDYISNGEYIGQRNNVNASEPRLIPFDADTGLDNTKCPNIEIVKEVLDFLNYKYILHSSFSNSISLPRYRIFFICNQIVNEKSLKNIYDNIIKLLYDNGLYFNPTSESRTLSQGWHLPRYTDETKKDIFKSYIGGNKYIEFDEFSISSTKITSYYSFIESEDIIGYKEMPDCIKYLCTNFEEQTGFRNFNTISMVLCSYAINKKMNQDQAVETFSEFICNYPYSSTLTSEDLRMINFKNRFNSMLESDYKFSCGYMKGLKLPGYAFECKKCKINSNVALWDYESACYIIDNNNCSEDESIDLIKDIYKNKDFDGVESGFFNKKIKKKYNINLGDLKQIESESEKKDLNHIEICNKYIAEKLNDYQSVVGNDKSIYIYKDGIYEQNDLDKIEISIANTYNFKACSRANDYKSISELVYKTIKDDTYFDNVEYKLATKSSVLFCVNDKGIDKIKMEPHSFSNKLKHKLNYDINLSRCPDKNEAPLLYKYLFDSFRDDKKQIDLLQEVCGATLLGIGYKMQKIVLLYGDGGNGKSQILKVLNAAISSEYKSFSPMHLLCDEKYAITLKNKTVNFCGDLDKNKQTDAKIKEIVGSDINITGRALYKNVDAFMVKMIIIGCCNELPRITDFTEGFFRRWQMIYYRYSIINKDANFGDKLIEEELKLFIEWSMFGAKRLIKNKFNYTETEEHKNIMENWKTKSSSFDTFINQKIFIHKNDSFVVKKDAYTFYKNWCKKNKFDFISNIDFYSKMQVHFTEKRQNNVRCFKDMAINGKITIQ